jgi:hypothetical protein
MSPSLVVSRCASRCLPRTLQQTATVHTTSTLFSADNVRPGCSPENLQYLETHWHLESDGLADRVIPHGPRRHHQPGGRCERRAEGVHVRERPLIGGGDNGHAAGSKQDGAGDGCATFTGSVRILCGCGGEHLMEAFFASFDAG